MQINNGSVRSNKVIIGAIAVLLIAVLACMGLSLTPFRIQVDGWQLEVIRSVDQTAVPAQAETPTAPSTPFASKTAVKSQNQDACLFVEPILAFIVDRPPDFTDDFSTDKGWKVNTYDQSGLDRIAVEDGQLRIFIGLPSVLTHVNHPQVSANNFVLSVDAVVETPGNLNAAGVGWTTRRNEANSFIVWTDQVWETRVCDGTGCNPNYANGGSGPIVPGRPFRMMVVAWDHQFALYLNGRFLAHVDDPISQANAPSITLFAYSNALRRSAVVAFDNLKFWNLDNLTILP